MVGRGALCTGRCWVGGCTKVAFAVGMLSGGGYVGMGWSPVRDKDLSQVLAEVEVGFVAAGTGAWFHDEAQVVRSESE